MTRIVQRLLNVTAWFVGGSLLYTSCGMEARDAVRAGFAEFITQTTVGLLTELSPFDVGGDSTVGDTGGGSTDPFDNPPVQS